MNKADLKEGDWVKVLRKPTEEELSEWNNSWIGEYMDSVIGKVLQVKYVTKNNKGEVGLEDEIGFYYPTCILEKTIPVKEKAKKG